MKRSNAPNFGYTIHDKITYQLLTGVSWNSDANIWEAEAINLDDFHDNVLYLCRWGKDKDADDEPVAARKDFTYCDQVVKSSKMLNNIAQDA